MEHSVNKGGNSSFLGRDSHTAVGVAEATFLLQVASALKELVG